jgi:hypothetical protein
MSMMSQRVGRSLLAAGFALSVAAVAEAGPPLICHAFDAGNAQLLPWGPGKEWKSPDASYDVRRLTADTVALLTPSTPILARMETLRRATIYAASDRKAAAELMTALTKRLQGGSGDPLAWFDAGYLIESYRQASHIYKWDMLTRTERASWTLRTEPAGADGYTMVVKAIALAGGSPDMEFAASLMKDGDESTAHRRRAVAGAKAGSLLARNLTH